MSQLLMIFQIDNLIQHKKSTAKREQMIGAWLPKPTKCKSTKNQYITTWKNKTTKKQN